MLIFFLQITVGFGNNTWCFPLNIVIIEPEDSLMAIGSGGAFAQAAAKALLDNTDLSAEAIVKAGLNIAAEICVYTNGNQTIEMLESTT